jgi:hypothetical protein
MRRLLAAIFATGLLVGLAQAPASAGPLYTYTACIKHSAQPVFTPVWICISSDIRRDNNGFDVYRTQAWVETPASSDDCDPGAWENPALDNTLHTIEVFNGSANDNIYWHAGPDIDRPDCSHIYNYPNLPGEMVKTNWPELQIHYTFHARLNNWNDFSTGLNVDVWINGATGVGYSCYSPDGIDRCERTGA